jgi:hypothetical protein
VIGSASKAIRAGAKVSSNHWSNSDSSPLASANRSTPTVPMRRRRRSPLLSVPSSAPRSAKASAHRRPRRPQRNHERQGSPRRAPEAAAAADEEAKRNAAYLAKTAVVQDDTKLAKSRPARPERRREVGEIEQIPTLSTVA